jgi:predicted phosphodiesterase
MIAILSDIHANLEALEAVLNDVAKFPVEAIYCLGDLVGYGPDPIPCLQAAMEWDLVLLGNHDVAALNPGNDLDGWSALAAKNSVLRARAQLQQHPRGAELSVFFWALRSQFSSRGNLFLHGSPRHPIHEYVFPEDIHNDKKMNALMSCFEKV